MSRFKNWMPYLALAGCVLTRAASADVSLPKVIGDDMVLQRGVPIAIWGNAAPGEAVSVRFAGTQERATADAKGAWRVALAPCAASREGRDMEVEGKNKLVLHNVVVGEVWLCSGQSNMEFAMGSNNTPISTAAQPWSVAPDAMHRLPSMAKDLAEANDPELRLFKVLKPIKGNEVPRDWRACDPRSLTDFSAVGYYFGRKLRAELKVPVGLIESSWGGTRIEPWTSAEAYAASPTFAAESIKKPVDIDGTRAGRIYDVMVKPLVPFTLRGFIWYQGESNVLAATGAARYEEKMEALIGGWRQAWANAELPFYYVQIAPLYYSKRSDAAAHPADAFVDLHEQQALAMKIPHTGMVVSTDLVQNLNDIHPGDKVDVGERLARWALAKDYGRGDVVCSGPIYRAMAVKDGKVVLSFGHGEGLRSADGKALACFLIAGRDGKFVPAEAEIVGETVVVSSAEVNEPKTVRFAWGEADRPNLVNGAGLPAVSFRTDGPALPE